MKQQVWLSTRTSLALSESSVCLHCKYTEDHHKKTRASQLTTTVFLQSFFTNYPCNFASKIIASSPLRSRKPTLSALSLPRRKCIPESVSSPPTPSKCTSCTAPGGIFPYLSRFLWPRSDDVMEYN